MYGKDLKMVALAIYSNWIRGTQKFWYDFVGWLKYERLDISFYKKENNSLGVTYSFDGKTHSSSSMGGPG